MDPWIHGSAAGAAARVSAGAAAASAAAVCLSHVIIGVALHTTPHVHDEIHTVAAPAANLWIHLLLCTMSFVLI